jgi:hypothetical protein
LHFLSLLARAAMPHPPGAPSRLPPCDLTGNKSCLERVCSLTDRPLRGPRRLRRRSRDQAGSACSARTGSRLLRAYLVGADPTVRVTTYGGCSMRAGIDEYQFGASVSLPTFLPNEAAASSKDRVGPSREAPAMPVPSEPFAAVYEDRNRLGVIVTRPTIIAWDCFRPRARLPPRSPWRGLGLSEGALTQARAEVSRPICKAPEAGRRPVFNLRTNSPVISPMRLHIRDRDCARLLWQVR